MSSLSSMVSGLRAGATFSPVVSRVARAFHYRKIIPGKCPIQTLNPCRLLNPIAWTVCDQAVLLKLYEHCGAVAVGRPAHWDLVKLSHEGRSVSWLGYPDFDRDPHPRLAWSYNVDMHTLEGSYRSYLDSDNRPLLHRKHEFLSADDPDSPKYRRLTDQEIRAGLYEQPHLIGNERGWKSALSTSEVQLRGHRVIRAAAHIDH